MKRMQDMEIGRTWFQVKELTAAESKSWGNIWNNHSSYVDIHDAYKKPCEAKVSIWNEWVSWARDVNMFDGTYEVHDLRIGSANFARFTVVATIREFDKDDSGNYLTVATYIMIATKSHNYLYKLASDESGEDIECW